MNFIFGTLFGLTLGYILNRTGAKPAARALQFTAEASGLKITGELNKMDLREGQKVNLTVMPTTVGGHAGGIEAGSARWSSSDESIVSVEQDPANPLHATARGLDGSNNESVVIEFRADGDQDTGDDQVKEIVGTLAVTCTQGDAATVVISAATPEDDEPAPGPPTEPETPAPVEPETPVEVPTEPETPVEPTPETPAEPAPETPAEPLPETPEIPTEPVNPDLPAEPETPASPVDPGPPTEPETPGNF